MTYKTIKHYEAINTSNVELVAALRLLGHDWPLRYFPLEQVEPFTNFKLYVYPRATKVMRDIDVFERGFLTVEPKAYQQALHEAKQDSSYVNKPGNEA